MSKMSDMAMAIEELRNAAATINDAANWLAQFSGNAYEQLTKDSAAEEKEKPILTLEQVRAVLADKSRAGHTAEIHSLIQKYGADRLSQIHPVNYKALLAEAEVLKDAT